MSYSYLASPYSDPDPLVMERRFAAAVFATAKLLARREWTFSPIVYAHQIAVLYNLPKGSDFWQEFNLRMLKQADTLIVLQLDGWKDSIGVRAELRAAVNWKIPTEFIDEA